jgi:ABC-type phosphate transport system, ATPase component
MSSVITTEDVHLYYGETEALHGINLNFEKTKLLP